MDSDWSGGGHLHRCVLAVQRTADVLLDNWSTATEPIDAPGARVRWSNHATGTNVGSANPVLYVHFAQSCVGTTMEPSGKSSCRHMQRSLVEKFAFHS